jgi:hypothetical protein
METDSVLETLCFLVFRILGKWTKSRNPAILSVIHHYQNPLDSTLKVSVSVHGNLLDAEVSLSMSKLIFIPLYPNPIIFETFHSSGL